MLHVVSVSTIFRLFDTNVSCSAGRCAYEADETERSASRTCASRSLNSSTSTVAHCLKGWLWDLGRQKDLSWTEMFTITKLKSDVALLLPSFVLLAMQANTNLADLAMASKLQFFSVSRKFAAGETSPRRRAALVAMCFNVCSTSWCGLPHEVQMSGTYLIPCALIVAM